MVFLQNCMAVLQSEPPSGAELCLRSSDDTNEAVGMEVEGVTDVDEEEGYRAIIISASNDCTCGELYIFVYSVLYILHRYPLMHAYLCACLHEKFGLW